MAGQGGSGIPNVLGVRAAPTRHSRCVLRGLDCWCGAPASRAGMWSRGSEDRLLSAVP